MHFRKRTHTCGELRTGHSGTSVVINGWVQSHRNMGGLMFIDLRDRYGITQAVILPESAPELAEKAKEIRSEFVLWIAGTVRMRENPNQTIPTGLIEILVEDFEIINRSEVPPFEITPDTKAGEELRLTYRYLDMRRPDLQKKFILRNHLYQITHAYFAEHNFLEFETPILTKSTPEGARDYLVPSRVHNGKFYALPQSPQLYKQILMMSGFDRYMQIVKCFRDEDLRADRQPEFTQIDVEMSFINQEDILTLAENFVARSWKEILGVEVQTPFPRMTFNDAMTRFGSDKPDLRFGLELTDITEIVRNSGFSVFTNATAKKDGTVALINAKGCAEFSRKQLDELTEFAKKYGAGGLAWMKFSDGAVTSPIAKFLSEDEIAAIKQKAKAEDGDLLLIAAHEWERCFTILGALRTEIARRTGILEQVKNSYSFSWVVEFPLLEYSPEENRYIARHHPFTAPMVEDLHLLATEPEKVRAQTHDLVINGYEAAGGSIRIHENAVQQRMFDLIGLTKEEAEQKFGFLLNALKYGAPPHGGIAFGFDRLVMLIAKTDNIREVIAFPKTTSALSLMDGCPSEVVDSQLRDLGIALRKQPEKIDTNN